MKENKYGLGWNRDIDPEKAEVLCGKNFPIFKEVKELELTKAEVERGQQTDACFPGDPVVESPTHLLIEGDNLHSLACLCYTYRGRVHMIYIDPNYNTGKTDKDGFVYRDKFMPDENDAYVRSDDPNGKSKWLSFMEKRLKLSKELLTEDGVIFISIDDHMFAELKLLCDGIFDLENFVANFIWSKKSSPKGVPPKNMVVNTTEYILVYQKSNKFKFKGIPRSEAGFSNPDNDLRGLWRNTNIKSTVKDSSKAFTITDPATNNRFTDTWAYSVLELDRLIEEKRLIFPDSENGQVRKKEFFNEFKNENIPLKTYLGLYDGQKATEDLKNILGEKKFNNPKPVDLIKYLIDNFPNKNAIVLDFFAGSGTTGHAVLDLNKEDGGKRQFILCTNNENNICSDVCYPRIKKVMCGYRKSNGEKVERLSGTLKYFQTGFVEWHDNIHELAHRVSTTCSGMLRTKEGVYNELESNEYYELYYQDDNSLLAIYKDDYNVFPDAQELEDLKDVMNDFDDYDDKTLYLFSTEEDTDDQLKEEFKDWKNVKIKLMPVEMIREYKKLFNTGVLKKEKV